MSRLLVDHGPVVLYDVDQFAYGHRLFLALLECLGLKVVPPEEIQVEVPVELAVPVEDTRPGEALRKLLNACGVLEFFDATVFSNEVLRRKPDLLIFNRAASLLRAEKKSIVHVGDNPDADFWGAKDAGMQAILLEESRPETSRWGPNSLYALGRANMRRTEESIPARLRVRSLTEVPALVDSMFEI